MSFTAMMMSGRPRINKSITISDAVENYNLITDGFGGVTPSGNTVVILTIEADVNVYSSVTSTPALDLTGLPDGSTIALTNLGSIFGMGGKGGNGGDVHAEFEEETGCDSTLVPGTVGLAAGYAVLCDGDVDLNITNAAGEIFGGGGGGGGGDACERAIQPCQGGGGGGGGGGAGSLITGGLNGEAGVSTYFGVPQCTAGTGNEGTGDSAGSGGSGGAGCGGACTGGSGGAGGGWGATGTVGDRAGGAGGFSVRHTGAGTVTYDSGGSQGVDIKGSTD